MKHVFVKVGTWLKSRFSKSGTSIVVENKTPEIVCEPTESMNKEWVGSIYEKSDEIVMKEVRSEHSLRRIKYEVLVDGKSYWLSKKQRELYWALCQITTDENGFVNGKDIVKKYLSTRYTPAELLTLEKWEYKPSTHYKAFKGLVKSGIVLRIGQKYKAV